jgi:hypothetical protein
MSLTSYRAAPPRVTTSLPDLLLAVLQRKSLVVRGAASEGQVRSL